MVLDIGSAMFAFIEVFQDGKWILGEPMELNPESDDNGYISINMAPPWRYDNIMYYYEKSGERASRRYLP